VFAQSLIEVAALPGVTVLSGSTRQPSKNEQLTPLARPRRGTRSAAAGSQPGERYRVRYRVALIAVRLWSRLPVTQQMVSKIR
jgi:hypothetical protein